MQGPLDDYRVLDDISTTTSTLATYPHPKWLEPYFDPSTPRNVTALMGKSAYLSCRVRNLGNKTVSDAENDKQKCLPVDICLPVKFNID